MRNGAGLLRAGALVAFMAGCAPLDPDLMDDVDMYHWDLDAVRAMHPQGSGFVQGLRVGYLELHDEEYEAFDWSDADHFARKAVASAQGKNVQPDMVSLRELSPEHIDELTAARARLLEAFATDAKRKAPLASARAQVAYDCWLEQQEEGDADDIERCKADFESAMSDIDEALASGIDETYVIFFAWDEAELTPVGETIVDEVAEAVERGDIVRVLLTGHTDTSGPADYNNRLSQRRARTVANALAARSFDMNILDVEWWGESTLRVPTADGVREPQNRRVEIRFFE